MNYADQNNMDYQTIATLLQLTIFSVYIYYIVNRFGVLESISESTYELEGTSRNWFLAFLGTIGLLNLAQPMELYGAFAMALLWFTGVTINHKSSSGFTRTVHAISAIGAIAISFIGLFMLHGLWMPSAVLVTTAPAIYIVDKPRFVWWLEIQAFFLLILSYFII